MGGWAGGWVGGRVGGAERLGEPPNFELLAEGELHALSVCLECELARGRDHDRAWTDGLPAGQRRAQQCEHGDDERGGLSRPCMAWHAMTRAGTNPRAPHRDLIRVVVYRVALGEPGPGADVAGVGPVLAQMWTRVGPVLAQMWPGRTRRGIAQQLSTGK